MPSGVTSVPQLTIALVDDHEMFSDMLSLVLQREPDLKIVGTAPTCQAARLLIPRLKPDLLLLDVILPDGVGLDLVQDFKRQAPEMSILVLTSLSDRKTLARAIDEGVNGFVSKTRPIAEVLSAIRQAASGEIVMPTDLLVGLVTEGRRSPGPAATSLTQRELELLQMLAVGQTSETIAQQLSISQFTVRTHIRNMLSKLGVHSRLEAVALALRQGLIRPPD